MKRLWITGAMMGTLVVGSGCFGTKGPAKLKPQAFYQAQTQPATQPSAETQATATTATPADATAAPASGQGTPDSATTPVAAANPAPQPAPTPVVGDTIGSFMLVGTVVGEANGQAIYADKILSKINDALSARARQLEPREFRIAATALINRQIMEDITNELEYAAAQRNLGEEEQQLATILTSQFRQKEITKCGGSLAVARARALADGIDFDERVKEEYRKNMIQIFYYKKVFPRVQVSADDMRRFYEMNLDRLFTEKSEVLFRVIRVGVNESGGVKDAWDRMKRIQEKVARGDDFADLAAAQDNRVYARQRGYLTVKRDEAGQIVKNDKGEPVGLPIQKGSLKQEDLEKAVFALEVGQVTTIIDGGDALYLAKLEGKTAGTVKAFEAEEVQKEIFRVLSADQRSELRRKEQKKLLEAAVTRTDEKAVDVAIEMAMQKYAIWNRSDKPAQSAAVDAK
ncbi:MAG TPA: peptidylprolyl isomerase [Tepidisphaeraceae bacterium]|nr:peptidylprolyl isomerase [Tepidisphaeraceae bacterium]